MDWLTIERFKEEGYKVEGLIEEIYYEHWSTRGKGVSDAIKELKRIEEAIQYKEREIGEFSKEESPKEEIEEMVDALSSFCVSSQGEKYLKTIRRTEACKRRISYMLYMDVLEKDKLDGKVKEKEKWKELAKFLQRMEENEEVSEDLLIRINRCSSSLVKDAKDEYDKAIKEKEIERARDITDVLTILGHRNHVLHGLLADKPTVYLPAIIEKIDLIEGIESQVFKEHVKETLESIKRKIALFQRLCVRGEDEEEDELYIDVELVDIHAKASLSKAQPPRDTPEEKKKKEKNINVPSKKGKKEKIFTEKQSFLLSIPLVIEKLIASKIGDIQNTIAQSDDPFEYLCKLDSSYSSIQVLLHHCSQMFPREKVQIQRIEVIKVDQDITIQKEIETIKKVLDLLLGADSETRPRYLCKGEPVYQEHISPEGVFKYMAICRRSMQRAKALGYTAQNLEQILKVHMAGYSLILLRLCTKDIQPFYALSMHLNFFLCIKRMYKAIISNFGGTTYSSALQEALENFSSTENKRSHSLLHLQKEKALSLLSPHIKSFKKEETINGLNDLLKSIRSTPFFDEVAEALLTDLFSEVEKLSKKVKTQDEVSKIIDYAKEIRKYVKTLSLIDLQRTISHQKDLWEALLVEEEDLLRVLEAIQATDSEIEQVKTRRGEIK
ncbi:hypothetical protein NEFER03_1582 [Nematocida sp. LUAm3]|nr:hypothetical protein NEFER03_1582 [Nematocida sp. LUAm3]KAI5176387.1 hypothetical protein NEFER02_2161 [Nematocida sp. LUAm2]KAI5179047.1 hypothetical protein NEFER01_1923 [Nematocida sp. LUAm1]